YSVEALIRILILQKNDRMSRNPVMVRFGFPMETFGNGADVALVMLDRVRRSLTTRVLLAGIHVTVERNG
ncbi:MAG TPA: hypothetical protein VMM58_10150, partial [Bacteroidota bacterium]|nr:hypothetical protein [Bacteroidota bacterium]